jgi:hypothetical protein
VIDELGRWGIPLMLDTSPEEEFRGYWLSLPVELYLHATPDVAPTTIEVRAGEEPPMLIEARDGAILTRPGSVESPDAVLGGPPQLVLGVISGMLDAEEATTRGLRFEGAREALECLRPAARV